MRRAIAAVVIALGVAAFGCEEAFNEEDARTQLARDLDAVRSRRGYVVYDFRSVTHYSDSLFGDEDEFEFHWTLTIFTSGDGSVGRLDVTAEGETDVITVIWTDEDRVICSTSAALLVETPADPGADVCMWEGAVRDDFIAPTYLASPIMRIVTSAEPSAEQDGIRGFRQRRLLRRAGHCYRYAEVELPLRTAPASIGGYEQCFAEDGIVTRVGPFGDEQVSYLLTAVEAGGVADADFEPPYPIVEPD